MAIATIEVEVQLENLRGFKSDLEDHYWAVAGREAPGDATRSGLGLAIGQLAQRIAALEELHRRQPAETVHLSRLAPEDARAIERAIHLLDGEFVLEPDASAATLWGLVRRLFAAVDEVLFAVARGVPEGCSTVGNERGRPRATVLALARS